MGYIGFRDALRRCNMGNMGSSYNLPKAVFYLLKGTIITVRHFLKTRLLKLRALHDIAPILRTSLCLDKPSNDQNAERSTCGTS